MDWLSINDFITPTNPWAALFFGLIFTVIIGAIIWFETKEKRAMLIAFIVAGMSAIVIVGFLYVMGFYS
ncbi:MAG TPA: hypothetical protein VK077_01435 [Virgibacillus sp.]|nr:hypothetical protein [Virgibacillus sp.]